MKTTNTPMSGRISQEIMDYKLVEIIWLDSWGDIAHLEVGAADHLAPIKRWDVGYLVKEDDEKVVITRGFIDNQFADKLFMDGIAVIPRGMIKDIRILND